MTQTVYRERFDVGLGLKREFRALCDQLGLQWNEHRGIITSTFIVRGRLDQITALERFCAQFDNVGDTR